MKGLVQSMSKIASPGNLSFKDWANDLNHTLSAHNIPVAGDDWKQWVYEFITINGSSKVTLPSFDTWQEWAFLFINDIK